MAKMMAIRTRIYVEIKAKASRCFTTYPFVTKLKSQFPDVRHDGTIVGNNGTLAAGSFSKSQAGQGNGRGSSALRAKALGTVFSAI